MSGWHVWTDGSCHHGYSQVPAGTRGWGGWCAIVEHGSDGAVFKGRVPETTNVRMEILAATMGLKQIPDGERVLLHTDSTVLLAVRDWVAGGRSGSVKDRRFWNGLSAQLERVDVVIELLGRGQRDPIHKRAHSIAGAEARGGLRNLPANATPLEDGHHKIRKGMRRVRSKNALERYEALGFFDTSGRLLHARDCRVGACVSSCPIWLQYGPSLR